MTFWSKYTIFEVSGQGLIVNSWSGQGITHSREGVIPWSGYEWLWWYFIYGLSAYSLVLDHIDFNQVNQKKLSFFSHWRGQVKLKYKIADIKYRNSNCNQNREKWKIKLIKAAVTSETFQFILCPAGYIDLFHILYLFVKKRAIINPTNSEEIPAFLSFSVSWFSHMHK